MKAFLRQSFGHRWTVLIYFALLTLACYIASFIVGSVLTPIKTELHLSDEQLGRLNTAYILTFLAVVPLAGYLGDRLPRKWFIFGSTILWSVASVGCGLATTFDTLILWRALVGLGEGVFISLSPSWIADLFAASSRSVAFAVIMSTSQIAAWLAYQFGSTIAASQSWHVAFYYSGVPGLILALGIIFLREPLRGEAEGQTHVEVPKPTRSEIWGLLQQKDYLLYLSSYLFRLIAIGGLFFWGAVLLHRNYSLSNQDAVTFIGSAYFFTGAPGIYLAGIFAGWLSRRFVGAYAFWLLGGELLAGLLVSLVLLGGYSLETVKILLLLQMFFAGNTWGVVTPLLFEIAPFRLRNTAVAITMVIQNLGGHFLAAEIIGFASDHYGIAKALLVIPAGYFIAAFFSLTLALRQLKVKNESIENESLPASLSASI